MNNVADKTTTIVYIVWIDVFKTNFNVLIKVSALRYFRGIGKLHLSVKNAWQWIKMLKMEN